MILIDKTALEKKMSSRILKNDMMQNVFLLATSFGLIVLAVLIYRVVSEGWIHLDLDFLTNFASRRPADAGIYAAVMGTLWLMMVTAPVSFILAVGTALYLEEYSRKGRFTRFIQMNISNLAGVPSIVFGLLGFTIFVRLMDMGRSVLAGGLTMSLLILPIIVVAAQEAIKAVPNDLKEASYGMGASKWQTIVRVIFPSAMPGILTGSILAFSRAIGETAPLIMIGALTFVAFVPDSLYSGFTVMPIQIYSWTGRPQADFHEIAATGIIVLLVMLLVMNLTAVLIRNKYQQRY